MSLPGLRTRQSSTWPASERMKPKRLENLATGEIFYDTLHNKQIRQPLEASSHTLCNGASMSLPGKSHPTGTASRPEHLKEAWEFLQQFHESCGTEEKLKARWLQVKDEIERGGTFEVETDELEFAAKTAWRNAPRCAGRIQWKNLHLFDCRHMTEPEEAFQQLCNHIKYCTNGGIIRPAVTIFPQRRRRQPDKLRIWNTFLVGYAGYEIRGTTDVIGDRGHVKFTKFCESLGWQGRQTHYDILPIIISGEDGVPRYFDIPDDIILRVKISHPNIPAISHLDLEWYGMPAVCGMSLSVGGVHFPATAFAGWYNLTEVVRDFLDKQRYDSTARVAAALGLDPAANLNLNRDRVATELGVAVLYSFVKAGVTIVDQYTQSEQFMTFFRQEHIERSGCPSDWVWLNPPQSSSNTDIFHQEMLCYMLSPRFDYQESLMARYRSGDRKKYTLSVVLKAVFFYGTLMAGALKRREKVYVYYATETGTSKRLAQKLQQALYLKFNPCFQSLDELKNGIQDVAGDGEPRKVFFVVSTFGEGSCPLTAKPFMISMKNALAQKSQMLKNISFCVFGLGSSIYPDFCEFGKFLDLSLSKVGATRMLPLGTGDEVNKQQASFDNWMADINRVLKLNSVKLSRKVTLLHSKAFWVEKEVPNTLEENYYNMHNREARFLTLSELRQLGGAGRHLLLRLSGAKSAFGARASFSPGDHLGVVPRNRPEDVSAVLSHLADVPEGAGTLEGTMMPSGVTATPTCTARDMIALYFDISGPILRYMLEEIAKEITEPNDKDKIMTLLDNQTKFAEFTSGSKKTSVLDLFEAFPSLKSDKLDFCFFVSLLQPLKQRWYSVANDMAGSSEGDSDSLDLVVSKVEFESLFGSKAGSFRGGVCTSYMGGLADGTRVACYHHHKTIFSRPIKAGVPLVMIANGSGIAPFRGIWQARRRLGYPSSETLLFFGCRNEDEDLCREEAQGAVTRFTAYSRQPGRPKQYVQDLVEREAAKICEMVIEKGGAIFVCGGVSMARSVKSALVRSLSSLLGETAKETEAKIDRMEFKQRYVEEIY